MKYIRKILLILILLVLFIYVSNISNIPNSILLFKGEALNLKTAYGIKIHQDKDYNAIQTSVEINQNKILNKKKLKVSFFNLFNIKDIEVNEIPRTKIVPLGNIIGLKLYANGVLVIGMTEIQGKKPYKNADIKEGDLIVCINSKSIETTKELVEIVNSSMGKKLEITYLRKGNKYTTNIEPVETERNQYKIGLWVRDGAVGVGTITYYEPSTKSFAALGHPIIDSDTGDIVSIKEGELVPATVTKIKKGEEGAPGEIKGILQNDKKIGLITENTQFGIYGILNDFTKLNINNQNLIEVALRDEIKEGDAKLISTLDGRYT